MAFNRLINLATLINLKMMAFFGLIASSEEKINKLLKNILCMKQSTFNKKTKMIKDKIICFDPKNTKFKRLLCVV